MHTAETNITISITQPKPAAVKKTDDSILDACCFKLKRFCKADKIVYVEVFGIITLCKRNGKQGNAKMLTKQHEKRKKT